MLYVPEPTAQYVLDSDAIFATAWQTTEYVAEYPANKGVKFYLVMDFNHYMGSQKKLEASWKLPFKKVTISQWLYENVESVTGAQDTINIPLGIDHKRFQKIIDISNRPKRIAMMYSFYSKYKAVDDGIQALKICKDKYPDLQVTIFGNYRTPKIPSWVDYRYNVSDAELINIYNQSRIFICSSLAEGFAFPPAEAMACGCAVVSTDCGGNREYAIGGVTALLSPPNDPGALAKNVIRLLEDDNLRIKLAQAGHEYIQQFTWERSTNLLEHFITKNIKLKTPTENYD
jgi:glycosyltransferase involved in cell wall biosynthesis